jgi:two-component system, NtrC family, sensor histidine kinase PilS
MGEIQSHAQKMKLAALGRLTANIAHEVRNPLSSIRYAAELLHENHSPDSSSFNLSRIIIQNTQRINHIIEEVMQLNQRDKAQPKLIPLHDIITHLINEKTQLGELPIEAIQLNLGEDLAVWCDPFHLERILWNLISNAWRHSQQNKHSLYIETRPGYTREVSVIEVIDDGSGIPETLRPHLFEPFTTSHRQGNGLGLYIARELTEANHGTLECLFNEPFRTNSLHHGAHFRIILPTQAFQTSASLLEK